MIGTSLGPYKIIEQIGAGGMGEVYLGEDTRLGRKVAIKVLAHQWCRPTPHLFRTSPMMQLHPYPARNAAARGRLTQPGAATSTATG